jgi:hemerythrin superfamily protein
MTTPSKSVENKTAARSSKKHDAINQLVADHAKVKKLFKQFKALSNKDDIQGKATVVNEICVELTVHALAEEEVFYRAARPMIHDDDLLNEANIEHDSAKDLIAQIQSLSPEDPMYDARVTVLGEYIEHHVGEEEEEMFPKVRKTKLDLAKLDEELTARKLSLKAGLVGEDGVIDVKALKAASQKALATKH